jgi:hypothetical protein
MMSHTAYIKPPTLHSGEFYHAKFNYTTAITLTTTHITPRGVGRGVRNGVEIRREGGRRGVEGYGGVDGVHGEKAALSASLSPS